MSWEFFFFSWKTVLCNNAMSQYYSITTGIVQRHPFMIQHHSWPHVIGMNVFARIQSSPKLNSLCDCIFFLNMDQENFAPVALNSVQHFILVTWKSLMEGFIGLYQWQIWIIELSSDPVFCNQLSHPFQVRRCTEVYLNRYNNYSSTCISSSNVT